MEHPWLLKMDTTHSSNSSPPSSSSSLLKWTGRWHPTVDSQWLKVVHRQASLRCLTQWLATPAPWWPLRANSSSSSQVHPPQAPTFPKPTPTPPTKTVVAARKLSLSLPQRTPQLTTIALGKTNSVRLTTTDWSADNKIHNEEVIGMRKSFRHSVTDWLVKLKWRIFGSQ